MTTTSVEHLGLDLDGVEVVEHDLTCDAAQEAGVGEGGADGARPHDGDLGRASRSVGHVAERIPAAFDLVTSRTLRVTYRFR
jgi:hypothetical protein